MTGGAGNRGANRRKGACSFANKCGRAERGVSRFGRQVGKFRESVEAKKKKSRTRGEKERKGVSVSETPMDSGGAHGQGDQGKGGQA